MVKKLLILLIFIFSLQSICIAKDRTKGKKKLKYYTYGLTMEMDSCEWAMQNYFNFEFYHVANCTVRAQDYARAWLGNIRIHTINTFRFGRKWYRRYYYAVDECRAMNPRSYPLYEY